MPGMVMGACEAATTQDKTIAASMRGNGPAAARSSVGCLAAHDLLLSASRQHRDNGRLACRERLQHLFLDLLVILRWLALIDEARHVQVVLGAAVLQQEADFAGVLIRIEQLVLRALYEGHLDVVRRGAEVLVLLRGEDVEGDDVRLGVPVLAGLGRGYLGDLAWVALDHDVGALPQLAGLLGVHVGRAGLRALEGVVVVVRHCSPFSQQRWRAQN
mmetsp:Transcript_86073/g.192424  ORF Transcript_86073/g.192424 Transcript_86073/m.192424 type:complete len:216 (-) Transcript_86073:36-683(-)